MVESTGVSKVVIHLEIFRQRAIITVDFTNFTMFCIHQKF
ncbi:hypothetical protein M123_0178 [Bacteroides fragilis str. 3976T8]|uniref:Uncharacterized protein n=1 Tax=Bacteroides fragilis str. 3976T8 TaxID=1339314 RepID=A0A016C2Z3_BACFG|nr:hypothetical protein M123_0178 [Bacteroides fragilis str. 3976T8]